MGTQHTVDRKRTKKMQKLVTLNNLGLIFTRILYIKTL